MVLSGNPTAPAAPKNGVCLNGIYRFATGGQDAQTPVLTKWNTTDFQIDVEFRLAGMPKSTRGFPVIMAGNGWRWIGIYVAQNGTVGVKYNNSIHVWSRTIIKKDIWYSAVLQYEKGKTQLYLDGALIYSATLAKLNTSTNKNLTTNDFSNGLSFHGCIRHLRVWNDANLTGGLFVHAGSRCGNLRMAGPLPWPSAAKKIYRVGMTGGAPTSPAFLFLGTRFVKPIDLTQAGGTGCTWFVAPILTFGTVTDKAGAAGQVLAIPNLAGLRGWFQWANFNPKANKLGWTLSGYATMYIGK